MILTSNQKNTAGVFDSVTLDMPIESTASRPHWERTIKQISVDFKCHSSYASPYTASALGALKQFAAVFKKRGTYVHCKHCFRYQENQATACGSAARPLMVATQHREAMQKSVNIHQLINSKV